MAVGSTELTVNKGTAVIAKILPGGGLDSANFSSGDGTDGYYLESYPGASEFTAVARQSGNAFVVAGTLFPPASPSNVYVTRFSAYGVHDATLSKVIDYGFMLNGSFDDAVSVNVTAQRRLYGRMEPQKFDRCRLHGGQTHARSHFRRQLRFGVMAESPFSARAPSGALFYVARPALRKVTTSTSRCASRVTSTGCTAVTPWSTRASSSKAASNGSVSVKLPSVQPSGA